MTALDRLEKLERLVAKLVAQGAPEPRHAAPKKGCRTPKEANYPRRIDEEARAAVVKAYNEMVENLEIPIHVTRLIERARKISDAVPVSVQAPTVFAIIAEHHGIQVLWSQKPPIRSAERTDDKRITHRIRNQRQQ
jgi:hypothetical protein